MAGFTPVPCGAAWARAGLPHAWLGLALLVALPAQGGRPLQTEDAGVLQSGECEWQTIAAHARARHEPSARTWSTELACGAGSGFQGAAALAETRQDASRESALGLSAKLSLIQGGDETPSVTLVPALIATRPDGLRGHRLETAALNAVMSWPFARGWTVHANLVAQQQRPRGGNVRHSAGWALAAQWAASDAFSLGMEAYGDDRERRPWYGAGALWNISSAWSATVACHASRSAPGARVVSASAKLAF